MSSEESGKRWRLDPNIRVGDLFTAIIVATAMTGAWYNLTGRVDRNEEVQRMRDSTQDAAMVELKGTVRDNIVQIRQDVQDTKQDVKELSRYIRRGSKDM